MSNGQESLMELAQQLTEQANSKKDLVTDTRNMRMVAGQNGFSLDIDDGAYLVTPTDHAIHQVTDRVGIPRKYADRMMEEAPDLFLDNVNHWFENKPEKRMVRLIGDQFRAFLSDRYQRRDNYDLLQVTLPQLINNGAVIRDAKLTETRLYLKAVFPHINQDIAALRTNFDMNRADRMARNYSGPDIGDGPVNIQGIERDIVQGGIIVSNSEVGAGALRVEPFLDRVVCLNGLIVSAAGLKAHHVGKRLEEFNELDANYEVFKDDTRMADDEAFFLKVRDTISQVVDENMFGNVITKFAEAQNVSLELDPVKTVEVTAKSMTLTDGEQGDVLKHLVEGHDLTQFGLVNAVTRMAQDVESYDRRVQLERQAWNLLETTS